MGLAEFGLAWSFGSLFTALFLLHAVLKAPSRPLFLFLAAFVLGHFSGLEWALWVWGYNLFMLLYGPIVPLWVYVGSWLVLLEFVSIRYLSDRWLAALVVIVFIGILVLAPLCMNCLRFE